MNYEQNRRFMKCPNFTETMAESDHKKGIPSPPHNKPTIHETVVLKTFDNVLTQPNYATLLDTRRSQRKYADETMTQEKLAFILWSAQGIQQSHGSFSFRPAPSGGARHAFETYIAVRDVEGLEPGLYRYVPQENIGEKIVTLEKHGKIENYAATMKEMMDGAGWTATTQAVIIYTCVPYRCEWVYNSLAHRLMLMDIGHIGQNVMLSAEAVGLGSCCIAAYNQEKCDEVLNLDGLDEYTVYAIPVGKVQ